MLFRKFEAVETAEGTRYLLDGEEIRHADAWGPFFVTGEIWGRWHGPGRSVSWAAHNRAV